MYSYKTGIHNSAVEYIYIVTMIFVKNDLCSHCVSMNVDIKCIAITI